MPRGREASRKVDQKADLVRESLQKYRQIIINSREYERLTTEEKQLVLQTLQDLMESIANLNNFRGRSWQKIESQFGDDIGKARNRQLAILADIRAFVEANQGSKLETSITITAGLKWGNLKRLLLRLNSSEDLSYFEFPQKARAYNAHDVSVNDRLDTQTKVCGQRQITELQQSLEAVLAGEFADDENLYAHRILVLQHLFSMAQLAADYHGEAQQAEVWNRRLQLIQGLPVISTRNPR